MCNLGEQASVEISSIKLMTLFIYPHKEQNILEIDCKVIGIPLLQLFGVDPVYTV